jgi:hypothetical protein
VGLTQHETGKFNEISTVLLFQDCAGFEDRLDRIDGLS